MKYKYGHLINEKNLYFNDIDFLCKKYKNESIYFLLLEIGKL